MPVAASSLNKRRLWIAVLCLWGLWAIRAHHVMALPVFVDESLHILRAQAVFNFTDAKASILPAKLLLYYYLGLFNPQDVGGAWLTRQAVVLLAPLGAALSFALARTLFHRWRAGFFTIVLYGLTPFLLFFERMALADTFVMIFGLALAIASVRLARSPSRKNAIWVGVWLGVALLAKLTALPWAVLPLAAIGLFGKWSWQAWRTHLLTIGVVVALCFVPSISYMVYQEINPPDNKIESVEQDLFTPAENSRLEQIGDNLETYGEAALTLLTIGLVVLVLTVGVWQAFRQSRQGVYLIIFTLSIWAFITLTAARPSARYLVTSVPGILILVAAGFDALVRWALPRRNMRPPLPLAVMSAAAVCVLVWAVFGLRFITTAWGNPADLPLAKREIWEYTRNTASGYGLREAADELPHLPRLENHGSGAEIPVAGFVGACHTMRLYLPADSDVQLTCPYFRWKPEFAPDTLAEWQARVETDGVWYFLADDEQPMDLLSLRLNWEILAHYERPHDGIGVTLYRVTPLAAR